MNTLLLIDGYNLLYRAYFSTVAMDGSIRRTPAGQPINAVMKVTEMLGKLLKELTPSHVAIVLDSARDARRMELYPEYKANRSEPPADLPVQLEPLHELLTAWGLAVVAEEGREGDDLIASLATKHGNDFSTVTIYSNDQDLLQCVHPHVNVLQPKPRAESVLVTYGTIQSYKGITPGQVPDFKALCGDKGDNLPGIPGVGEVTAKKLLGQYGTLEAILENSFKVSGKVGEKLAAYADQARMVQRMATLYADLAVPELIDLAYLPTPRHRMQVNTQLSAWGIQESGRHFTADVMRSNVRPAMQKVVNEILD